MNPDHQHRLDEIIEGQRQVHQLVRSLDLRVEALRRDLQAAKAPVSAPAPVVPPPAPRVTVEPPPLPRPTALSTATEAAPPPLPALSAAAPLPSSSARSTHPLVPPRPEASAKDAVPRDEPFELRFGTFWLVRIGIVIFLTGLVFLGNFAYQHFVVQLGAVGKLALLYLAGGTLLGAGLWLERKRESMRNYARVLTAGGAAAVYYTTYAAHYVAQLRVIESAFVGGLLLLALAGGIVWIAERKRSETLALLAVLLAYYTSSINAIGLFTLFSAVLLSLVSLFFLLRHGWTRLSIASLVGTYASYGFWRFHSAATDGLAGATEFGSAFLATYWVIFTAAIFVRSTSGLSAAQRMPFFTANNAAFFVLGSQHIVARWPSSFWLFALSFGVALLALAWHAARRFPEERALDGAALAQGIALITVGLAAKLNGFQLGLTLAAESVVLLTCSRWRHPAIYKLGAALAALGATLLTVQEFAHPAKGAATLGACVAAFLLFDAWWIKRLAGRLAEHRFELPSAGFAVCGLFVAGLTIWDRAPAQWQPAIMAGAALACALSLPFVRLPEIALPGQLFLGIALLALLPDNSIVANALVLCAAGLALEQWWRRQRFLAQSAQTVFLESASAIVAIFAGWWWLLHQYRNDDLMIAAAVAGAGMFLYAIALRARATLLAGQFYTGAAIVAFAGATTLGHPNAIAALVPILAVILIAWLARRVGPIRFSEFDRLIPFAKIALVYAVAAMLLGAGWVFEFVPAAWHVVVFAAASALFLLLGRFTHVRVRIVVGALIGLFAMALFCARIDIHPTFAQLIAIVAIPAAARLTIRTAPDEQALSRDERNILAACALGCIWLWVTRWTQLHFQPVHLTFAWSLLALAVFAAGFAVRERIYRLGGLAILALAIGRVFFVDLWQFETIYRILGFLVLGAVLLLLGFTYNRFSEQLRRWL